jgi:hypothetical protein
MLNYTNPKLPLFGLPRATRFGLCLLAMSFMAARTRAEEPQRTGSLTQYRINEYAAECLTCEMAFSGLKGEPKPGETPGQFTARIDGYAAALDRLGRQTEALRSVPAVKDASPENLARWHKIARAAVGLPSIVREIRAALHAHKEGITQPPLGPGLMSGLVSVQVLLNTLRDARP